MNDHVSRFGWIYGITTIVFFLIDLVWIGVVAQDFYTRTIGGLLRDSVNWPAALMFYFFYIGGIVVFVLAPALKGGSGVPQTALMGGLLGLFAYGTFDLTALALLDGWPVIVALVDMVWGTVLTAATAGGSLWIAKRFLKPDGLERQ
ncbi:membrane protein [Desulfosarcina widdelii]|uniref:Membrane protein n=1 Tax=Desulfosarcina widdelii TaxID=947919 RepID=A0A5K7ZK57_9BACT|nr:DUF2177 family protein [Desulfosarcina widdelii]BBO78644.1 membrane protein [Desulfosarcina widdelii]